MSANAYEILALAMRYVFAGLMVIIVLRAWRLAMVDSARAKRLRRLSPETGIIGEMLVMDGDEKARPGMRYPLTLEGMIGSSARADIRIRHGSVRARHAYFTMTEEGLYIRGHASARIGVNGRWMREATLKDGGELRIGRVTLMLVLTGADAPPEEIDRHVLRRRRIPDEEFWQEENRTDPDLFHVPPTREELPTDPDELFFSNPASCLNPEEYDYDDGFDPDQDEY